MGQPASRLYRLPPSPAINNTPLSDVPRWVSQHHGSIDRLRLQLLTTHHSVMPPAINNRPLSDAPRWVSQHHSSIDRLGLQLLTTDHSMMPPVGQPTSRFYRPPPSPAINNISLSDAHWWVSQHHSSIDHLRLQLLTTHHSVMPPGGSANIMAL